MRGRGSVCQGKRRGMMAMLGAEGKRGAVLGAWEGVCARSRSQRPLLYA